MHFGVDLVPFRRPLAPMGRTFGAILCVEKHLLFAPRSLRKLSGRNGHTVAAHKKHQVGREHRYARCSPFGLVFFALAGDRDVSLALHSAQGCRAGD